MIVDRRSTDGQPTVKAKMRGRTKEERRTKWSKWTEQILKSAKSVKSATQKFEIAKLPNCQSKNKKKDQVREYKNIMK